jgi:hypothetical protein
MASIIDTKKTDNYSKIKLVGYLPTTTIPLPSRVLADLKTEDASSGIDKKEYLAILKKHIED